MLSASAECERQRPSAEWRVPSAECEVLIVDFCCRMASRCGCCGRRGQSSVLTCAGMEAHCCRGDKGDDGAETDAGMVGSGTEADKESTTRRHVGVEA